MGWRGPPYDVNVLASLRGLSVRFADWLADDQDGCLVAGLPPVIYVNESTPNVRARYTIAHEVVHSLLEMSGAPSPKHWKFRFDGQSPVEQVCQVGASELLMPSDDMLRVVGLRSESLEIASEIRGTFDVSLEAAARNLVDLSPRDCAMVVLQFMNKPSEFVPTNQMTLPGLERPLPQKRLRIRYGWTSRSWDDHFLPEFKSIPDDSILYSLVGPAGDTSVLGVEENWTDVGNLGRCTVDAVRMHDDPDGKRVLCILGGK